MVQKWSQNRPKTLVRRGLGTYFCPFGKKSLIFPKNTPQKPPQGIAKGPQKSTIFSSFFGRFLGRLREPSRNAFEGVWGSFRLDFGTIFGSILGPKSRQAKKVKIELSPRRELSFWGPGHPRNDQKNDFFRNPFREGSWDPSWSDFCASWLDLGSLWAPHRAPKTFQKTR